MLLLPEDHQYTIQQTIRIENVFYLHAMKLEEFIRKEIVGRRYMGPKELKTLEITKDISIKYSWISAFSIEDEPNHYAQKVTVEIKFYA